MSTKQDIEFADIIDRILNADDSDVWDISREYFDNIGCDTLLYAYIDTVNHSLEDAPFTYRSTAPDSWFEHYFASGYHIHDHVAVMRKAGHRKAITLGSMMEPPEGHRTKISRQLLNESGEVGFKSTLNFWLPGQTGLGEHDIHAITIGTSRNPVEMRKTYERYGKEIGVVAQMMHNRLSHSMRAMSYKPLTNRETQCLTWVALGFRADRIADKIGIATPTVNFHLSNARKKLKAKTLYEALGKAINLKIVTL